MRTSSASTDTITGCATRCLGLGPLQDYPRLQSICGNGRALLFLQDCKSCECKKTWTNFYPYGLDLTD